MPRGVNDVRQSHSIQSEPLYSLVAGRTATSLGRVSQCESSIHVSLYRGNVNLNNFLYSRLWAPAASLDATKTGTHPRSSRERRYSRQWRLHCQHFHFRSSPNGFINSIMNSFVNARTTRFRKSPQRERFAIGRGEPQNHDCKEYTSGAAGPVRPRCFWWP